MAKKSLASPRRAARKEFYLLRLVAASGKATQRLYLRKQRIFARAKRQAPSRQHQPVVVVSLFDYTCLGLEPWKERGFEVHAYDRRHPKGHRVTASGIHIHGVNLHTKASLNTVVAEHAGREIAFAMAFPPCTELSRAGARYWKVKGQADPHFQDNAAALVKRVDSAMARMKCPYFIENPSSSTLRELYTPHKLGQCDKPRGLATKDEAAAAVGAAHLLPPTA